MAGNSGYSSAQILSMQKDAVRRVNEMQRIARERLQRTENAMGTAPAAVSRSNPPAAQAPVVPEHDTPQPVRPAGQSPVPSAGSPFTGILDRMGLDSESTLLLLLLLLLVNEGADNMLILALVYVLL